MREIERRLDQVKVNGKAITILELTGEMVADFVEGKKQLTTATMKEVLASVCDATEEDFRAMTPGQMKGVYGVFKEVNEAFFDLVPLDEILAGFRTVILQNVKAVLSGLPAASLPLDITGLGIMGGDTSPTV